MSTRQWHALESNPYAINTLMNKIECADIFSFESEVMDFLPKPQLVVILCFKEKDDNLPINLWKIRDLLLLKTCSS
ncbi:unnamed protein product [Nippostrongylus brasiliensis]|uniref:ubiquitinyl hydrolase 1 n=1 Tax=Nippostrongylus brasiliensis TaxID=27835 RepID=A0A0N4YCS8_NIPBR|nr:unnamed protein product [Nippostrongylus brasiliensis]